MAREGYNFKASETAALFSPMLDGAGFMDVANGGFGVAKAYGFQPELNVVSSAPKGPSPSI
jgi:hypothetical protein